MFSTWIIRGFIFYVLASSVFVSAGDIFDIFPDSKTENEKKDNTLGSKKTDETCPVTFQTQYRTVLTAYRHLVKTWIEKFPNKDARENHLALEFSSHHLKKLEKFSSSSRFEESDVLHEIHSISDLLQHAAYKLELSAEVLNNLTWSGWFRSFDINVVIQSSLLISSIGIIVLLSLRTYISQARWFSTFFMFVFIISVIQNGYAVYQEEHAKADSILLKELPKHCLHNSKGTFDSITSYFAGLFSNPHDECLTYHKALRIQPLAQATLVKALSMTVAQLFITPLGSIGENVSLFFAGTMRHVSTTTWIVIMPASLLMICFGTLVFHRYEMHLPMLLSIRSSNQDVSTSNNKEKELQNELERSKETINQLESKVKNLEKEKETLAIQCETISSQRDNQSSNERINLQSPRQPLQEWQNIETEDTNLPRQRRASPTHTSRSSNIENINQLRERSSSNRRNTSTERLSNVKRNVYGGQLPD